MRRRADEMRVFFPYSFISRLHYLASGCYSCRLLVFDRVEREGGKRGGGGERKDFISRYALTADAKPAHSYIEAINLLYSTNTFSFINPSALRLLTCTILPQRRAAIRVLHLHWSVHGPMGLGGVIVYSFMPQEEAIWESFWRVVREELIGLKEIRVWILADRVVTGEGDEARMLAPL